MLNCLQKEEKMVFLPCFCIRDGKKVFKVANSRTNVSSSFSQHYRFVAVGFETVNFSVLEKEREAKQKKNLQFFFQSLYLHA